MRKVPGLCGFLPASPSHPTAPSSFILSLIGGRGPERKRRKCLSPLFYMKAENFTAVFTSSNAPIPRKTHVATRPGPSAMRFCRALRTWASGVTQPTLFLLASSQGTGFLSGIRGMLSSSRGSAKGRTCSTPSLQSNPLTQPTPSPKPLHLSPTAHPCPWPPDRPSQDTNHVPAEPWQRRSQDCRVGMGAFLF